MEEHASGNVISRGWRSLREAGPQRLALTAMLVLAALAIARYSWFLPGAVAGAGDAEPVPTPLTIDAVLGLYDLRALQSAPLAEQDQRVLIIAYDDQTLINARKRSPLDRGMLVEALKVLDTVGAKAIGIDIIFDQPQNEDGELVETLRSMETPTAVAYVDKAVNPDDVVEWEQQQYLDEFHAALEGSRSFSADIRLSNAFGTTRIFPDVLPDSPPLISRAMVRAGGDDALDLAGYEGAIDYRLCARCGGDEGTGGGASEPLFPILQIDLFTDPEIAFAIASQFEMEGKYILIGANVVDVDRVETTLTESTGQSVPGVTVHAEMLAQMLDGRARPAISPLTLWLLALAMVALAVFTALLEWRNWRIVPLIALQLVILLGLPFLLHARGIDTYGLPAFGWIVGWVIAFAAITSAARASGAVERNFAQGALGKYLPKEMAREIIDKPNLLALHGEKKQIYVLFSDLEGFTKMSHAIQPEQVASLLNRYLEMLSQVVLDHGGVIDKFVGDAVVAFWGAPIARPDDAERAARAGYAIWQAGEDFRAEVAAMDPDLPPIGKTRVGLHFGEAVVGNFGGENRIQYTALGDSMNTAARLEAANKALDSSVMASAEFAERTDLDWWRPMGKVVLRGRARPVDLREPAPQMDPADRKALADALALPVERRVDAIAALEAIISRNLADKALANLLHRLREMDEEEVYVLG